jgi:hypothetical protein
MLALVGICLIGAGQANAEGEHHWPAERILAPEPGNKACWRRVYGTQHLREHPKQKIKEMLFFLRVRGYDAKGGTVLQNPDHISYNFAISMKRRGDRRPLQTSGDCLGNEGTAVECVVDCDAGGVNIEKAANGEGLAVYLRDNGIAFGNDCDTNPGFFVKPGADDKVFLLTPAPAAVCSKLETSQLAE